MWTKKYRIYIIEYPFRDEQSKQNVAQKLSFMIQNTFGQEEGMP